MEILVRGACNVFVLFTKKHTHLVMPLPILCDGSIDLQAPEFEC